MASTLNMDRLEQFLLGLRKDIRPGKYRDIWKQLTDSGVAEISKHIKAGAKVLDVGFGSGRALDLFKHNGYETYGISLSPSEIEQQKDKHKVSLMDMSFLEFDECFFDVVWARHSLEHSIFPYFTLTELYRVMKPGAFVYIEVPAPKCKNNHENYGNHYSIFDKLMWVSLMRRTGFEDINAEILIISKGEKELDKFYRFIARRPFE